MTATASVLAVSSIADNSSAGDKWAAWEGVIMEVKRIIHRSPLSHDSHAVNALHVIFPLKVKESSFRHARRRRAVVRPVLER
jgi:hypothetical protein